MRPEITVLSPGVTLTSVRDERFKTGCVSISLITPLDKKTAALNSSLPFVLSRGTARHPDTESLEAALDDLYGARIEPFVRKRGECQIIGFYADFADPAFIPEKRILEKVTALMGELLLAPALYSGRFRRDFVETERDNLVADIRAEINDRRFWATGRLIELMCAGEAYGVPRLGRLREAEKVSVATLTNRWHEVLRCARIEIFYCGSAPVSQVERALKAALSTLPVSRTRGTPMTAVIPEPKRLPRLFIEAAEVHEAQLRVGYRLGGMEKPDHPALLVLNSLLGGSSTSRLFLDMREKRGLAYSVSSQLDRQKGIMLIAAGIDAERYPDAMAAIDEAVADIQGGQFTDEELEGARQSVAGSLYTVADSQPGLESFAIGATLMGIDEAPEELAQLSLLVTREDVMDAAAGIKKDTVYLLREEAQDA